MVSAALLVLAEDLERQAKALMFGAIIVEVEIEFPVHEGEIQGAEIVALRPRLRLRPTHPVVE